jgi:hypothetical protein
MSVACESDLDQPGVAAVSGLSSAKRQRDRIAVALGLRPDRLPRVDAATLSRYCAYLSANLSFPFTAYYHEPTDPPLANECHGEVFELIAPATYRGHEIDGIFCKTRKGTCEVKLPLIDLHLRDDDPNSELIEDYWYWFWNWQR